MRDKTNLKNRIKGLLGIILSVCTLVSMSGMNVYAVYYDMMNANSVSDLQAVDYVKNGQKVEGTGGELTISGFDFSTDQNGDYTNIPEGKMIKLTISSFNPAVGTGEFYTDPTDEQEKEVTKKVLNLLATLVDDETINTMSESGTINSAGVWKLENSGMYDFNGAFSVGDGFTYTGGSFYAPAGTYTFRSQ